MRKLLSRLVARVSPSAFSRNESGAVAILFGLAFVPLVGVAAVAVDYQAGLKFKARLNSSLDAAVLQAATNTTTTTGNVQAAVESILRANMGALASGASLTVTASMDASRSVTGDAALRVPTMLMKLFNQNTMTITSHSKASSSSTGPVEIALVLDTTSSMSGAKIAGLQAAALDLSNTLFTSAGGIAGKVKMGIAPFDRHVNVGTANAGASWLTSTASYTDPVQSCWDTYPNATYANPFTVSYACTIDGTPQTCSYTDYATVNLGAPVQVCQYNGHAWYGCVGSRSYPADLSDSADAASKVPALIDYSCGNELLRLTTNHGAVQSKINSLAPYGETYIAPGLLWGWRILSPNPPFADGAAYNAVTKYIILMTDGANTYSPSYPEHNATNVADANSITAQTCTNIKAQGIKIFSIAFTVTDPAIKTILQNCANTYADYYDSTSVADLQGAFRAIGSKIMAVRLVQ